MQSRCNAAERILSFSRDCTHPLLCDGIHIGCRINCVEMECWVRSRPKSLSQHWKSSDVSMRDAKRERVAMLDGMQ